jgi:hypothetical protein
VSVDVWLPIWGEYLLADLGDGSSSKLISEYGNKHCFEVLYLYDLSYELLRKGTLAVVLKVSIRRVIDVPIDDFVNKIKTTRG